MLDRLREWVRSLRSSSSDNEGSVWNHIPSWQYTGRHAESGGISRAEQERALSDIQRQAEAEQDSRRRSR